MDVSDHALGEEHGDVSDIFMTPRYVTDAGCGDRAGPLGEQIVHDGQVVHGQIPDDIHILLEQTEVYTHRVVVIDVAQRAVVDQLPHFSHSARIHERVVHHEKQFAL